MGNMKQDRFIGISCFILLFILHRASAQENFEDADKLSDLISANSEHHFDLRHTIPGIPDVDYPIYSQVPRTSFECTGHHEGYYADKESRCQAFRICTHTARSVHGFGFLCPNGTLFSQKHFVCDWYRNVDCNDSERYFSKNDINRVGSNFDMMETVRQMIEYPMKTISKALQQKPSLSRRPTERIHGGNNAAQFTNDNNAVVEVIKGRGRPGGSSRTSVTRDQVESVHNRGSTKYGRGREVISSTEKDGITENQESVGGVSDDVLRTTPIESGSGISITGDVYVNSLGELSTDPGVTFDRTNAHIIAEPRPYRYEKNSNLNLNFAEKVNAGLNNLSDLPINEGLAPDYVKTLRDVKSEGANIDLPSNVNGLIDEIANDLNPKTSGYQLHKPTKTKHSFRFLSRGFSSQNDPYSYKKPKQTESTIKFVPNQLPADEEKPEKKPFLEIANEAVPFGHSTTSPNTQSLSVLEETVNSALSPVELPSLEDVPYLSPPLLDPIDNSATNLTIFESIGLTIAPHDITDSSYHGELFQTTTPTTTTENSTVLPDIAQNLVVKPQQQDQTHKKIADDGTIIDEERIDVNKQAESLFISGLQLTNNENNTETTTTTNESARTPLLIQVPEDHSYLTDWVTSTIQPVTDASTISNPETQPESGSLKERIRNNRRLTNSQRGSAKPLIYGKRAGLKLTKMTTTSTTTTTTKPASTTRSYLKRIAASRLRLSRLTAVSTSNKQQRNPLATTSAPSTLVNTVDSTSAKKLTVRNIDKETASGNGNNISDSNDGKTTGTVTWESVKSSLKRFQVQPKSENEPNTYGSATTNATKINSTSSTSSSTTRNGLARFRNRGTSQIAQLRKSNDDKSSETSKDPPASKSTSFSTSMSVSSSSSSSSSTSPSSSSSSPSKPLSFSFASIVPTIETSPTPSTHSINLSTTSSNPPNSYNNNGAKAVNTNLNSNAAGAPEKFIPFDELFRHILDDSNLQSYRGGPILGRSSLASTGKNYQPTRKTFSHVTTSPAFTQTTPFTYNKIRTTATPKLTPSQSTVINQPLTTKTIPTTAGPNIVVARAEGQRIQANDISTLLSSLITQQQQAQPKPTPSTSYVPLDDFLTNQFGAQSPPIPTQTIPINYQQPQYQQQQNPPQQLQYQQYQQLEQYTPNQPISNQQYQQPFNLQPFYQTNQQQQQITPLAPQQQNQINFNRIPANQRQLFFTQEPATQLTPPTRSFQPLNTQNIFASFKQQQEQLPVFPPFATQRAQQPSSALQSFNGNNNFLNVQLPTLSNGLIPAPNQFAQKRNDNAIDGLSLVDFKPTKSAFIGASSYDVPLSSIGRLPNDIQALFRRLRKY